VVTQASSIPFHGLETITNLFDIVFGGNTEEMRTLLLPEVLLLCGDLVRKSY